MKERKMKLPLALVSLKPSRTKSNDSRTFCCTSRVRYWHQPTFQRDYEVAHSWFVAWIVVIRSAVDIPFTPVEKVATLSVAMNKDFHAAVVFKHGWCPRNRFSHRVWGDTLVCRAKYNLWTKVICKNIHSHIDYNDQKVNEKLESNQELWTRKCLKWFQEF